MHKMAAVKDGAALYLYEACVPEIKRYNNINTILIKNMRKGLKNETRWLHILATEKRSKRYKNRNEWK